MMTPDSVSVAAARKAAISLQGSSAEHPVDDETIAALVEGGIEAVRPSDRAVLLRAIGNSPEVAALVADLAPAAAGRLTLGSPRVLGLSSSTWRAAWAACALVAIAVTAWHMSSAPAGANIALLDGGVDGPSQDFADSLQQSLRRKTVIMLWALLATLTAPALLTLRRTPAPARSISGSVR